jgi:hypothetical protein
VHVVVFHQRPKLEPPTFQRLTLTSPLSIAHHPSSLQGPFPYNNDYLGAGTSLHSPHLPFQALSGLNRIDTRAKPCASLNQNWGPPQQPSHPLRSVICEKATCIISEFPNTTRTIHRNHTTNLSVLSTRPPIAVATFYNSRS